MEKEVFKEKIYAPYNEAWKVIKLIQYAGQDEKSDATWQEYVRAIDEFAKKFENNTFKDTLVSMLLDAGDTIAKMNGGTE
jgi:hypothetical protein